MKRLAVVVLAGVLGACATTQERHEGGAATEGEAAAPAVVVEDIAEVTFIDSTTFDEDLSKLLGNHYRKVIVVPSSPFSINALPERLDKWFYKVKESGNQVTAQALPPKEMVATRSVVGALIDVVVAMFGFLEERTLYAPAERYDVNLLYHQDTGMVANVVFTHK